MRGRSNFTYIVFGTFTLALISAATMVVAVMKQEFSKVPPAKETHIIEQYDTNGNFVATYNAVMLELSDKGYLIHDTIQDKDIYLKGGKYRIDGRYIGEDLDGKEEH